MDMIHFSHLTAVCLWLFLNIESFEKLKWSEIILDPRGHTDSCKHRKMAMEDRLLEEVMATSDKGRSRDHRLKGDSEIQHYFIFSHLEEVIQKHNWYFCGYKLT